MGSTFDVKYDLILAVLSQIFEKLPIFFLQTCLGVMDIGSFRKKHVFFLLIPTETPDCHWPFWMPVVGRNTFSPRAPAFGPQLKNWPCHPILLFMAVSAIPKVWQSNSYCKQHSWLTKLGYFGLNQLVNTHSLCTAVYSSSEKSKEANNTEIYA